MLEREKENILLVDDRQANLLVLEGILDGMGYNLFTAISGQQALRILLKHKFNLVLLDVQMPGMNGFEVAELIRGRKESQDITIIFITALSKDPEYIKRGYEVGAENYLFKPIDPEELKAKVRASLRYYRYKKQMALHEMRSIGMQERKAENQKRRDQS